MSKGEDRIAKILLKNNINFESEVSVPYLTGKKGAPLRFDFGIFQNNKLICLIEFDGQQHFQYSSYFHKKKSDFTYRRGCDRKKNEWALAHNIPLYRIPYWELDNLFTKQDLFQSNFLVSSIYHNDRIINEKFGGN